jgi:hypothetical protein
MQVASPEAIAAAEKEGATRLKACTTEECRGVISALNAKKMAKLTGAATQLAQPGVWQLKILRLSWRWRPARGARRGRCFACAHLQPLQALRRSRLRRL